MPKDGRPNLGRLLAREDKWFIGGARSTVFAPEFPLFLDTPGFWDGVHFADQYVRPLFTVVLLDEAWHPFAWHLQRRRWTHEALEQTWISGQWLLRERRVLAPPDICGSQLRLTYTGDGERTVHGVWWSAQTSLASGEGYSLRSAEVRDGRARLVLSLDDGTPLTMLGGFDEPAESFAVQRAEPTADQPLWRISPFAEMVQDDQLSNETNLDVGVREIRSEVGRGEHRTTVHVGLHRKLSVKNGSPAAFEAWASLAPEKQEPTAPSQPVSKASRDEWERFLDDVPVFTCDDEAFERYYWYRWWGLRVHTIDPQTGNHRFPSVVEGIGGFRRHISYSAQCHLWEMSWLRDPTIARGIMRNMIANRTPDGPFPGSIGLSRTGVFYHADWSHLWQVHQLHPDTEFLRESYGPIRDYVGWLLRERDREGWHLVDVINQGETGQEYQHRYLAADPHADDWGPIQLKGVGESVYAYRMARCAARIGRILGDDAGAQRLDEGAGAIRSALLERCWDPDAEWFFDVVPPDGHRSDVFAAIGLYPFMTDVAGKEHLGAIHRHLLNPDEFWTTWPVPAESVSDPMFDAEARWRGERKSCPWNGRNWPMSTCHVAEALARASDLDPALRRDAATLIRRFVRMMCYDHDAGRPNCYEHYNPFTGTASEYRGVDDYQHSWVVDLIVKYVAGLRPQDDSRIVVDPLPFGLSRFLLDGVRLKGHDVTVRWEHEEGLSVAVDGTERARRRDLGRIELAV